MKYIYTRKWLLVILPLFYCILSFIFLDGLNQFYICNSDPTYVYLFNCTNIASGHFRSGNIVHPGTPVEIFAGLAIFIKHLFTHSTVLYQDVLMNPESYLYTCSVLFSLLLSYAIYFSGSYVYRYTGSLGQSILFQIAPLVYPEFVWRTVSLGAESALGICGIFFAAYLYVSTQLPNKEPRNRDIVILGLLTALWFTTKIYTLAVGVLVLFLLKNNKQRLLYIIFAGLFSFVFLFPLYNQFKNWLGFIKAEAFHNGPYGQGDAEKFNAALYWNNITTIFKGQYILSTIYMIAILVFSQNVLHNLKYKKSFKEYINPITGIVIFLVLFMGIISKQYIVNCLNPLTNKIITLTKYYYFIPVIVFFPLVIMILYKNNMSVIKQKFISHHKLKLVLGILGIFLAISIPYTVKACYDADKNNVAFQKTRSFIEKQNGLPLIFISDGGKQVYIQPALFIGSYYSGKWDMQQYLDYLKKLYPDTYIYSIGWKDALTFWNNDVTITDILNKYGQAMVYISGADSLEEESGR